MWVGVYKEEQLKEQMKQELDIAKVAFNTAKQAQESAMTIFRHDMGHNNGEKFQLLQELTERLDLANDDYQIAQQNYNKAIYGIGSAGQNTDYME